MYVSVVNFMFIRHYKVTDLAEDELKANSLDCLKMFFVI